MRKRIHTEPIRILWITDQSRLVVILDTELAFYEYETVHEESAIPACVDWLEPYLQTRDYEKT